MPPQNRSSGRNKKLGLLFLFLSCLGGFIHLFPRLMPGWTRINSVVLSVNRNTGLLRREWYLGGVRFRTIEYPNAISCLTMNQSSLNKYDSDLDWMIVASSPIGGTVSPHYSYHGVDKAIKDIEDGFVATNATEVCKRQIANEFLHLLSKSESVERARDFANRFWKISLDRKEATNICSGDVIGTIYELTRNLRGHSGSMTED